MFDTPDLEPAPAAPGGHLEPLLLTYERAAQHIYARAPRYVHMCNDGHWSLYIADCTLSDLL
jgi:hypothetical protein